MKGLTSTRLMTTVVYFFIFGLMGSFVLKDSNTDRTTADQLLTQVHKKLESIKAIQYGYLLELNYPSENYTSSISGTAFLDFSVRDSLIGFTYQLEDAHTKYVYNGTESFFLDKRQKTMRVNVQPKFENFTGITPFHNSLVTLGKAIPALITDNEIIKSASDTSIADQGFYLIKLVLNKRVIERLGGFSELTQDRKIIYDIIIDKNTYLPVQMLERNNVNKDFKRSVFNDVTTDPSRPAELTWYYTTYVKDFAVTRQKPVVPLALDSAAPDWELPVFDSNQSVSLRQLKGKVVLLEFWTKNCGYSIAAVPKLNTLSKQFEEKDVVVLGVNLHDKKEDIHNFNQRTNPNYETVYDGQQVAEAYGVSFYPTIVLLNKKGQVLSHGELDESALNHLIMKALRE